MATTTKAAREHAIERWHLPHWMEDVEVDFEPGQRGRSLTARVEADGSPVAGDDDHRPLVGAGVHLYQSFQQDDDERYMCNILFEGDKSEHEEETGSIKLFDHPFNKDIDISEVYEKPFREMWMREGHQLFDPLSTL